MDKINYNEVFSEALVIIKKNWWKIVVIVFISAAIAFGYKKLFSTQYTAKSIFYPDKKEATLSGNALELIKDDANVKGGSLGILSKILTSRSITARIASTPVDNDEHPNYKILADWIIDDNNKSFLPWEKKTDISKLSKAEKIKKGAKILRDGCFAIFDESGFMSLQNVCYSEDFALYENQVIIAELIKFNFESNTQKAKEDLINVSHRVDSINEIYETVKMHTAKFNDENKYMIKSVVQIPLEDLIEQKKIIEKRYLALIDLQEQSYFRYQHDKPIIKILDTPYISNVQDSNAVVFATLIGLLMLIVAPIFFVRKLLVELLKSEIGSMISKTKNNTPTVSA